MQLTDEQLADFMRQSGMATRVAEIPVRIPVQVGHRFRFISDTCSDSSRTPIPVISDTRKGGMAMLGNTGHDATLERSRRWPGRRYPCGSYRRCSG